MAQQAQLRALCKKGKLKELLARLQSTGSQEKLKQGFKPDLSQPIHYAALYGDFKMVRELVETYGCDPVCQNVHGITPLHCASYCGRLNVVEYLLKRCPSGATLKDTEGACPLVYLPYCMIEDVTVQAPLDAIKQVSPHGDRIPIFKRLLSVTDFQSIPSSLLSRVFCILRLPVHRSSLSNMKDLIHALKPVLKSEEEFHLEIYNCLKIAVNKKRWGFVKYLLQRFAQPIHDQVAMVAANTKSTNPWKLTPFQEACKKADISIVKIFLDLNICKPDVMAIKVALDRECYELLRYLLISARRPIVMDQYQHSTSFLSDVLSSYSYRSYDQKFIKLIASNGINGRDAEGNTVLHLACKHVIMFLIEEHCSRDQNVVNKSGQLPLHIACSQCKIEIVKLVSSEPGLNVNTQDS